MTEAPTPLSGALRERLLEIAGESIKYGLTHGRPLTVDVTRYPAELQAQRASFVTLHVAGALRGCIGSLEAARPLIQDVAHNAYSAAFEDPRFPPVTVAEADRLDIHISVLTPAEPLSFASEHDLVAQLRPGVDGLILIEGARRGTFLPSVWDSLPEPRSFLRQLKVKAGLPEDYWSQTLQVHRYTTESFPPTSA